MTSLNISIDLDDPEFGKGLGTKGDKVAHLLRKMADDVTGSPLREGYGKALRTETGARVGKWRVDDQ
jgi:hypothetical protein